MSITSPPSSRPPGVPPPSGNAKYVALVALLAVAVILAVWKLGGQAKSAAQLAPTSAPTVAPPTLSKIDEVPPPPPEPEDAGAPAPSPSHRAAAGNPCDMKMGACAGTLTTELEDALALRAKAARRCYELELAKDPTLQGRVQLRVKLATDGTVCSVTVASQDIGSGVVAQCAARMFTGMHFSPPKGGCVETVVPIAFVPGTR